MYYINLPLSFRPRTAAMKLHLSNHEGNRITACRDNTVYINGEAHAKSLLVLSDKLVTGWNTGSGDITPELLEQAAAHSSAGMVVLLGKGEKSPPITPQWQPPFAKRQAALEIMSLPAACRTYNFLCADGRLVMAALVL